MAAPCAESSKDDFLICNICCDVFTDPRILPCLHTFCFRCITARIDTAVTDGCPVVCPKCQEPVTPDVSILKENVFIDGLAQVMKSQKRYNDLCVPCELRQSTCTAENICLDCGDLLCKACRSGHNFSSLTLNHRVASLKEIRQGKHVKELRQLKKVKCQCSQKSDVQFYCQSCVSLVCMSCVVVRHRSHSIQEISEAAAVCKSKIKPVLQTTRQGVSKLSIQESSVLSMLETVNSEHRQKRRLIEQKAEKEIARIQAEKEKALKDLDVKTKTTQKGCNEKLENVHFKQELLNSCLSFCDNILERGKDEEVLMLETMITERLQILQGAENQTERDTEGAMPTAGITKGSECLKTLKIFNTFSVTDASESLDDDIRGLAYSPTVGLAVADKANGCITLLKENGDFQGSMSYPKFAPSAVAICRDVIAAVSENYLYLLKISGSLVKKITLHDNAPNPAYTFTFSLTAHKKHSYIIVANIPDDTRLYCYGTDGNLSKHISCPFTFPVSSMSVTPDDCIVVCEWKAATVRVISMEGTVLMSCEPSQKWRPSTVCSGDELIFVMDCRGKGSRVWGFDRVETCQLLYEPRADGLLKMTFLACNDNGCLHVLDRKGKLCVYSVVSKELSRI